MKKRNLIPVLAALLVLLTACTGPTVTPNNTITQPSNTAALVTPLPSAPTAAPSDSVPTATPTQKPTSTPTQQVITAAPTPTRKPVQGEAQVVIKSVGDIMCHDNMINAAKTDSGYDFTPWFQDIQSTLADGDVVVANLETTLNGKSDSKYIGYPYFNTPEQILEGVKAAGVNFLFTSNNHSFDTKFNGVKNTIAEIKEAGIDYTGTYTDKQGFNDLCIKEYNGIKIGFMNYTYGTNIPPSSLPSEVRNYATKFILYSDPQPMYNEVKRLKAAGAEIIIAGLHWGVEYSSDPEPSQRKLAQNLFEHGVDIIFGGHPHCVQRAAAVNVTTVDGEEKTCYVAYSMGNFIADQRRIEKKITETGYVSSITAVRDASGKISLQDFSITPTWIWRTTTKSGQYTYKILPLGKYATMAEKPDWLDEASWTEMKSEWTRVKELLTTSGVTINLE